VDHQDKLGRAKEHLDALDESVRVFSVRYPYTLSPEFDAQQGDYALYFRQQKLIPRIWSLVLGDTIHNIRSALDNLVYLLGVRHSGAPRTKREVERPQFVIADTPGDFAIQASRRLFCLSPQAQAVTEGLQPYQSAPGSAGNPLALLRDLNDIDKQRHLVLAYANLLAGTVRIAGPGIPPDGISILVRTGILEDGTVVARYTLPASVKYANVDVESGMVFQFSLADSGQQGTSLSRLSANGSMTIFDYLRMRVFPRLEALL